MPVLGVALSVLIFNALHLRPSCVFSGKTIVSTRDEYDLGYVLYRQNSIHQWSESPDE